LHEGGADVATVEAPAKAVGRLHSDGPVVGLPDSREVEQHVLLVHTAKFQVRDLIESKTVCACAVSASEHLNVEFDRREIAIDANGENLRIVEGHVW
jgi:hypothetical protein